MLPGKFLSSLQGIRGFDRETFEEVHTSGEQVTSIRINPVKNSIGNSHWPGEEAIHHSPFTTAKKIPWTRYGYYLEERPSFTFDPLFHAGCYYVQEASSMFLEQALAQTTDLSKPLRVLDLCAAPGGKSTHLQSLLSKESLLVSNELIKSRVNILKDNIIKWGCENVVVTNNDPKDFSALQDYFDVILIDAPCSGSGLFRREPDAINEWSENNVKFCSMRQQRIIADVFPALKKNGLLIYCTCSYSREEDEDVCEWINEEFNIENFKSGNYEIKVEKEWNIVESSYGYRFWPDKLKGEGFFLACFRKKDGGEFLPTKSKNIYGKPAKKEVAILEQWIGKKSFHFIRRNETIYAVPEKIETELLILSNHLRIVYNGVAIGQIIHDKIIPDHALALSQLPGNDIPSIELDYEKAIEYLKKKDLKIDAKEKGWQLVNYKGNNLGWINVLTNRINNYYPKELRILKES